MSDLFDAFEIESIANEEVIDTNPDIYVQRAELALKERRYECAVNEIDDAINYANDKDNYIIEKIKILHAISYGNSNYKNKCRNYILSYLNYFYNKMPIGKFCKIIQYYNDTFRKEENNIIEVLKSKGIPYVLGYNTLSIHTIESDIIGKAYESLSKGELTDAWEYSELLNQKYHSGRDLYVLKGDILVALENYNRAIDYYTEAIAEKGIAFDIYIKIINTYILKYKKQLIKGTMVVLIIIIAQFFMFRVGIIPSIINSFELNIKNGVYTMIDSDSVVIPLNETVKVGIDYKLYPFYGNKGFLKYKINDENIAKINKENEIIGLKEGKTSLNIIKNGTKVYSFNIVVAKPSVDDIKLDIESNIKKVGDSSNIDVTVKRNYDFGQMDNIVFESTNDKILKVDKNGSVEAVGIGSASIIVKCDNKQAKKDFDISASVIGIEVNGELEVEVDEVKKLDISIKTNPEGAIHPNVVFKLEKRTNNEYEKTEELPDIFTIDDKGNLKGLEVGEQNLNIICDNFILPVKVKVNQKSLKNCEVKNLKTDYEIVGNELYVDLSWDNIEVPHSSYEVYKREKSKGDTEFKFLGRFSYTNEAHLRYNLSEYSGDSEIEFYVIAKENDEESKKSDIVSVKFNYDNPNDITNKPILGFEDKSEIYKYGSMEYINVRVSWDNLNADCRYSLYVRDNNSDSKQFVLKSTNLGSYYVYSLGRYYKDTDLDIYVVAENEFGKSKKSQIINIKYVPTESK